MCVLLASMPIHFWPYPSHVRDSGLWLDAARAFGGSRHNARLGKHVPPFEYC